MCLRVVCVRQEAIAKVPEDLKNARSSVLDFDRAISANITSPDFPTQNFGAALAGSLIPWIDKVPSLSSCPYRALNAFCLYTPRTATTNHTPSKILRCFARV